MNNRNVTIRQVLPPHPENMADAFKLGEYNYIVQQLENDIENQIQNDIRIQEILANATKLVEREKMLTSEELHGVYGRILEIESHISVITRVKGFFSFVNILWLGSILGITISFGPFIYHSLKPLQRAFIILFDEYILPAY